MTLRCSHIPRVGRFCALLSVLTVLAGCRSKPSGDKRAGSEAAKTSAQDQPAASASAAASAAPARLTRPAKPLNVLLITVDALRADMPWAGYERPIAPNLTELAKQAVVYENHRTVSSYTAQSVATLLSGRYASTLYRSGWFFTGYRESNLFFPEILQSKGIGTLGVHAHMYFGRGKGLEQGFDIWRLVKGITFDAQTDNHVTSHKSTEVLIEELSKPKFTSKQFFAWAHYMDPHDVYVKHKEAPDWGRHNRDRYDSEVFYTDLWLGKLFDFCRKQPWWSKTAVVITSDHGEAFGEHGMYKHAFEIWEVLVRVPLLFVVPGAEPKAIASPRTHIDLAPTILDLMGQKIPDSFTGQSLVPEIFGAEPPPRDYLLLELTEDSHNPPRRAIIKGDYKLVVWGKGWRHLLFNLKQDPGEEKDLSKEMPDKLAEMKALYSQAFEQVASVEPYGGMKLKSGRTAKGPMDPPSQPAKQ